MSLPSLHNLSVKGTDVGVILDDPDMPRDTLEHIERLTLDSRRGVVDGECIIVKWTVTPHGAISGRHVMISVQLSGLGVRPSDGELMRGAIDAALLARGGPLPIDKSLEVKTVRVGHGERRVTYDLDYIFNWAGTKAVTRGLNLLVASLLMDPVLLAFADTTGRHAVPAEWITPDIKTPGLWEHRTRLCAINPGEPGFLGKVAAKALRHSSAKDVAADVGVVPCGRHSACAFPGVGADIGVGVVAHSCGGDSRFWGAEGFEAARKLTQRTDDWYAARRGKMTASSAYTALGLHYQQRMTEVVEGVLFGHSFGGQTADMRWGVDNEHHGINAYRKLIAGKGEDVHATGLWLLGGQLDPMTGSKAGRRSWFGASPDGIVVRSQDGAPLGLVEVKCKSPLAFDRTAEHGGIGPPHLTGVHLDERKRTPIGFANPSALLNERTYMQVILQIRATAAPWCDVVFWTPYWMRVVRVRSNNALAEEILAHLNVTYQAICANKARLLEAYAHGRESDAFGRMCTPHSYGAGGVLPERLNASEFNKQLRAAKKEDGLVDWGLWKEQALLYSEEHLGESAEADAYVNDFIQHRLV